MGKRVAAAVVAATLLAPLATITEPADAVIATVSGQITKVAPLATVLPAGIESAETMYAFDEQQGVTLASNIRIDMNAPGTYATEADRPAGLSIPAGTVVDSHFLYSNRPTGEGGGLLAGTMTFPTDILGVIITRGKLAESDVLGAAETVYGGTNRELVLGVNGNMVILPDLRSIYVQAGTTTDLDHVRIITRHDSPPVANAGGPYAGVEGSPIILSGAASDAEGGPLSVSWGFTWTGDPGTTCAATGATTLTPTLTCTDDALVTATLSVSDGVHAPVTSNAQVTVGNAPPAVGALSVPTLAVPVGGTVAVSAPFTDPGTNDTHTATVTWGDTTSSAATVTGSAGSGTASGTHVYSNAGVYTVTLTVTDDDLGAASTSAQVVVNGPPTADAGGPYTGDEGTPIGLVGVAIDPDGDPLATQWTFAVDTAGPGTVCTPAGVTTLVPSLTCNDDAVVTATLEATDGVNPPVVSSTTVTAENSPPVVGTLGVTSGPIATGQTLSVVAPFTDAGTNDTHTATVDWGDLTASNAAVTGGGGTGLASASHQYAQPGIYSVTVTVTDDDGGFATATTTVVVNSPPTADAGGPYVGFEGDAMVLTGTASDPDGDALSIAWTFTSTGDPGLSCAATGTGTLTPTVTCNDDAVVTATLTVSDGVNAPVASTTTLTVGNRAPTVSAAIPSASPAPTGSTVSVGLTYSDAGTNDTHAATVDWGDGTVTAATVSGSGGSGVVSGSHVYAAPGLYTITVTVTDDDGGAGSSATTVLVNGSPEAGAGGPYSGVEGAGITLFGTATDPDADVLTILWTHTLVDAEPGTACSLVDETTLTPTLTCNDDAEVAVHITVDDGINPPVVDSATVLVANAAPSIATPTITPNPTAVGTPVSLAAAYTDPGVNDTHIAAINWGDATNTSGTVTEFPGSGSVSGTHTYSSPGTYTVTVLITDKDGGFASASATVVVNSPVTVDAGGPYSGVEGRPTTLSGTATDADGDPLGVQWTFTWTGSPGTACSATGTTTLTPSVTCNDDAVVTATLTVSDGVNAPVTDTAQLVVANAAPTIATITVPLSPVPVGTAITASATFADAGSNDTHAATFDWRNGATTPGTVTETNGSGSASASYAYTAAGTYTIEVTVTDDDAGSVAAVATTYVVVYDPSAGFVTGGGWIMSPSGAYTPDNGSDADVVGKANFGFVSRYTKNGDTPIGNTEFQLHGNGTNMKSTGHLWLVVTDNLTKAYYRGTGRVNGVNGYEFVVSVIDGRNTGVDRFRIKVWNPTTGVVVYDNLHPAPDDASASTAISGGSIVIHG